MPLKLEAPNQWTPYYKVRGTYLGVAVERSSRTSKRAVAQKVLKQIEREIERGEFAVPGEPTFASAAAEYMKAGGERTYLTKLLEHFGETRLSKIDQAAVEAAAAALYPQGSAATRNRSVFTPVSAVLKHVGCGVILKRPKGHAAGKQTGWLWPEQAEAIFAEAEKLDKEFAALLVTLCYTGMRLSEALGLTWDDVRLQDGYAYLPDTKNGDPRAVHLPPVAVAALAGVERQSDKVFRFCKSGHLYHLLRSAAFKAGVDLPSRSAFHIFRHTYATWMRRYAGLDTRGLVGTGAWKDSKSAERYAHSIVTEEARKADLLPVRRKG